MSAPNASRQVPLGAIGAAVGGIVAAVAAFMSWVTSSVGSESRSDFTGIDGTGGVLALALGVAAVGLAAAWALGVKDLRISIAVVGVGILLFCALCLAYVQDLEPEIDNSEEVWRTLNAWARKHGVNEGSTGLGIGFMLEILAGGLLILSGLFAFLPSYFLGRERQRAARRKRDAAR